MERYTHTITSNCFSKSFIKKIIVMSKLWGEINHGIKKRKDYNDNMVKREKKQQTKKLDQD